MAAAGSIPAERLFPFPRSSAYPIWYTPREKQFHYPGARSSGVITIPANIAEKQVPPSPWTMSSPSTWAALTSGVTWSPPVQAAITIRADERSRKLKCPWSIVLQNLPGLPCIFLPVIYWKMKSGHSTWKAGNRLNFHQVLRENDFPVKSTPCILKHMLNIRPAFIMDQHQFSNICPCSDLASLRRGCVPAGFAG